MEKCHIMRAKRGEESKTKLFETIVNYLKRRKNKMMFNLISNAITTATTVSNVVKPTGCRMPDLESRIKWDPKEGSIKLEEKKRNIFNPIVY